mmetsp:Transcript_43407/g.88794  ORF Transcript_43407/g.88794 Transcript_43407/m.88794 type:complete len:372 (+) Transcript_43407:361-1476(+)
MLREREADRRHQPHVLPWRKGEQGLALGDGVECVEHLDGHEDGERKRARLLVVKHLSRVPVGELDALAHGEVGAELLEGHERPRGVLAHPPDVPPDRGHPDVRARHQVPGEHPAVDELISARARRARHDARLGRVEGQRRCREAVRYQIHPQERDRAQDLGQAKDDGEEHTHHLPDVRRDQVPDEGLGVGVDGSALFHCSDDGGEVVVGQHHLRCPLCHRSATAHGNANVSSLECRGVVDAIPRHRRRVPRAPLVLGHLEELDDVFLVDGLGAREEGGCAHRLRLLRRRHVRKLPPGERFAGEVFAVFEDANHAADGLGSLGVVSCDDHDADACLLALPDRVLHLLPGRVEDASQPDEGEVALDVFEFLGV